MKPALSLLALAAAGLAVPLAAPPAEARFFGGGIVYDPANHAQNVLQAVRALQEIDNQIRQLTHEIAMLENMARDLTRLPHSVEQDIARRLSRIDSLMRRAEGVAYRVDTLEADFSRLYPESADSLASGEAALLKGARAAWHQSRAAWRDSLEVTAGVISSLPGDTHRLQRLIRESQGAVGNLQVIQAGNQIAAMEVEALIALQTLIASSSRAEALDRAGRLAEKPRAEARRRAFFGITD
jgi:type IV secretion system protein TrbJ